MYRQDKVEFNWTKTTLILVISHWYKDRKARKVQTRCKRQNAHIDCWDKQGWVIDMIAFYAIINL